MSKDLYKSLNIQANASQSEIKQAYRKLAKQYHPDLNKSDDSSQKFKEINDAYEILGDKGKRIKYDQFGDSYNSQSQNNNFDDMFNNFRSQYSENIPLDVGSEITIPFNTAILGGSWHLEYNNHSFDIKIPIGTSDGTILRVAGKGNSYNNKVGNLLLTIYVSPSPEYYINGFDIFKNFDISLKEAWFDSKITVNIPEKEIILKVPKNTKNNQKFKISGKGFKNPKTKEFGNLYLVANVLIPDIDSFSDDFKEELLRLL